MQMPPTGSNFDRLSATQLTLELSLLRYKYPKKTETITSQVRQNTKKDVQKRKFKSVHTLNPFNYSRMHIEHV